MLEAGAPIPTVLKIHVQLWTHQKLNYSCPLISVGNRFQDPLWLPKYADAPIPYIKWHGTMHTVGPPDPQIPNHR